MASQIVHTWPEATVTCTDWPDGSGWPRTRVNATEDGETVRAPQLAVGTRQEATSSTAQSARLPEQSGGQAERKGHGDDRIRDILTYVLDSQTLRALRYALGASVM